MTTGQKALQKNIYFSRLHYPVPLLQSTIRDFVTANVSGDVRSKQMCDDKMAPAKIILPFKDQRSAHSVRRQLGELSHTSGREIHPCTQAERSDLTSSRKKANPLSLTNSALFTIFSVICPMRIMSATHVDTCINALKNIRDLNLVPRVSLLCLPWSLEESPWLRLVTCQAVTHNSPPG